MTKGSLLTLMAILSAVLLVLVIVRDIPGYYSYIPLLPFASILIFVFTKAKIGQQQIDVASALIFGISFVRYCLIPFLMVYGGYNTIMKIHIEANARSAILLMVYEEIVIYFALVLSSIRNRQSVVQIRNPRYSGRSFTLLLFLLAYVVIFVAIRPQMMDNYMSIFSLNQEEFTHAGRIESLEVGTVMRTFSTLFTFFFNILRIVFPVYLVGWLIRRKTDNTFLVVFVLALVFLQFLFISATFAESIVCSLIVILAIGKSSPEAQRKMLHIAPVFVVGIIVLYFYVRYLVNEVTGGSRYSGDSVYSYLCSLVNAYFTGIDNVAASLNVERNMIWEHLTASLQITIPFNTTIFGKAGESLPTLYNAVNQVTGQIPSTVGNCYYYVGPIFSPLFSGFFSYYSVKFNAKASSTSEYWHYIAYLYISIVCALALGMYNEVIALGWIGSWGIPLWLVAKYMDKTVHKKA